MPRYVVDKSPHLYLQNTCKTGQSPDVPVQARI
jgi:hypothetical protein